MEIINRVKNMQRAEYEHTDPKFVVPRSTTEVTMLAREHHERLVLILKRKRQGLDDGRAELVTEIAAEGILKAFDSEIYLC